MNILVTLNGQLWADLVCDTQDPTRKPSVISGFIVNPAIGNTRRMNCNIVAESDFKGQSMPPFHYIRFPLLHHHTADLITATKHCPYHPYTVYCTSHSEGAIGNAVRYWDILTVFVVTRCYHYTKVILYPTRGRIEVTSQEG